MSEVDADRNLLFGVLALQHDLIDREQFADACAGWAVRKDRPLADLLVERGWIGPEDREQVDQWLQRKLKKHGQNVHASLVEVADAATRDAIRRVDDPDVRTSLAGLPHVAGHVLVETLAPSSEQSRSRYSLSRLHAEGGLGKVWVARDQDLNREVALKELRPEQSVSPEACRRFLKEAQVTGQLEHPNIVPVYELARRPQDDLPFYTMRLVRGQTLRQAIADYHQGRVKGGADPLERLRLLQAFVSVCQAIGYAHSRGVIHRDLKPENVVLGGFGEVIVLDWGLAKLLAGTEEPEEAQPSVALGDDTQIEATRAGTQLGTPAYMAPEQAQGRIDLIDARTDVYGLGSILFEILTGEPPHSGRTTAEVLNRIATGETPRVRSIDPSLPKALEAICARAMAKVRSARYGSCAELSDDVQRWVADEPVLAYPERLVTRAYRWARRRRKALGRAAVVVLAVTAMLVATTIVRQSERRRLEAQRLADRLEREAQVRLELNEFRRQADEARYFAAMADPVSEYAPYLDASKAETALLAALSLAGKWGPLLGQLPPIEERKGLETELYDLLLLTAQVKLQRSNTPQAARDVVALLDHAGRLQAHSQTLDRLTARANQILGDNIGHSAQTGESRHPHTYLDHFLLGEQHRRESVNRPERSSTPGIGPFPSAGIEKAIAEYRRALALAPNHYWSLYQLGRCYLSLGRLGESVEALGTCIALRPEAPWGYLTRGLALARQNRHAEAERDLDRASRLGPGSHLSRLNRGWLNWEQKKHNEALAEFDNLLQPPREKQVIEAAYYRGQLNLQRGEITKALEDLDWVIKEIPRFPEVYLDRARVLISRGEIAAALEDLDRHGDLRQARPVTLAPWQRHARRGQLLRTMYTQLPVEQRGTSQAARALLNLGLAELLNAVSKGGHGAQLYDDTGTMLELAGRLDEAIPSYTRGLDFAPRDASLRLKRGWVLVSKGRYKQAEADFVAALALEPENGEAHSGLGYVRAILKHPIDAQCEAELALLHSTGRYLVLHNVACIYAGLAEADGREAQTYQDVAISLLRRAIELWKREGTGPSEIEMIKGDSSLKVLHAREDFQDLIRDGKS